MPMGIPAFQAFVGTARPRGWDIFFPYRLLAAAARHRGHKMPRLFSSSLAEAVPYSCRARTRGKVRLFLGEASLDVDPKRGLRCRD